jgi:ATP/ADP translocase
MASPWSGVARRLGLEPEETARFAVMGALVATLLCAYTIAKILRDTMFLTVFGAFLLPYAYLGVAIASALVVWVESRAARRFSRIGAAHLNQYVAVACSAAAALAYPIAPHRTTALFYLWTGSQAMMLLPHFWVLALDVWDSRRARRIFPMLGGFGLIGGTLGGVYAGWAMPLVRRAGLMWTLCALLVLAHALTRVAERHRVHRPGPVERRPEGARLRQVLGSRYVRVFATGLALSVVVSTLVDFQFKVLLQQHYLGTHEISQFLGRFYAGVSALSLLFQFGIAGWLIQRIGLAPSTGLQPASIVGLATVVALTGGWWAVLAMRWVQGVVFQTLGKSTAEIYYTAIRASERRWIKPAVDTLVERWSDALVGIGLIIAFRAAHVPLRAIAITTAILAAAWIFALLRLNQQYGHAYRALLSSRRVDPSEAEGSLREPPARAAVLQALRGDDEPRVLLALKLAPWARDAEVAEAVRTLARHPTAAVRTTAVEALEEMRVPVPREIVDAAIADPHEPLRRAAIGYRVAHDAAAADWIRAALDDPRLRGEVLDALYERPWAAQGLPTWAWIDARLREANAPELLLAARALGIRAGKESAPRFARLFAEPDRDVRVAALRSAARRPRRELLERLLPLLDDPDATHEARLAIAAIGDPAVAPLERILAGAAGARAQAGAAATLAWIASPRAARALMHIVRSPDAPLRDIGLRALARLRGRRGEPVLPRSVAHAMLLRELGQSRERLGPALALDASPAPELRLLAESYHESADLALQRALEALACAYEPGPIVGVYERLRARGGASASAALDYLGTILPRPVFRRVSELLEPAPAAEPDPAAPVWDAAAAIRQAWASDDAWLRACAVRAVRAVPGMSVDDLPPSDPVHPLVAAELDAAHANGAPHLRPGAAAGGASC